MSISSRYPEAKKLSLQIQHSLHKYEQLTHDWDGKPFNNQQQMQQDQDHQLTKLHKQIENDLNELKKLLLELSTLLNYEPQNRKDSWKLKVVQLSDEYDQHQLFFQKKTPHYLHFNSNHNNSSSSHNNYRDQLLADRQIQQQNLNAFDSLNREKVSLGHSIRAVDDMLEMGHNVYSNLSTQKDALKSAQKRALDIANSLGLSNSLLILSDRKARINAWITYGCMILTLIITFTLYYYVR